MKGVSAVLIVTGDMILTTRLRVCVIMADDAAAAVWWLATRNAPFKLMLHERTEAVC